ncbi:MAG: MFS transporter [Candidatus Eisenbacteria bacterium]|jgi:MFS family permease|nr:MFS transporter [Candidatus Eisenbacteria bacterium]
MDDLRFRLQRQFPALTHRNFRLLWLGQLVSVSGSMMQSAAILWHVAILVPDNMKGLALGAVGLVRLVPVLVFSLVSGVVADTADRRRLMLVSQTVMTLVAVALCAITLRGLTSVWPCYLLAAINSAAWAFDGPARQSLIPNLVPREHLPNAISLNAIMFQTASVVGPSLAGVVIATLGTGWVYACNAVSFLGVIIAILLMRGVQSRAEGASDGVSWRFASEGLRFVFSAPLIRSSMLLDFFATFFASATALLPIFAQDILKVGPRGYGWLYAAPSVGALLASLAMVRISDGIRRRGQVMLWCVAGYGLATVVFGISRAFWLTFLCLALTGATDIVSTILRNVIRQLHTPDRLRGRMTSVNMIFFMGGPQLGEMEAGAVASLFGAPISVVTGGLGCLLATAWIAKKTPELRHYHTDPEHVPGQPHVTGGWVSPRGSTAGTPAPPPSGGSGV